MTTNQYAQKRIEEILKLYEQQQELEAYQKQKEAYRQQMLNTAKNTRSSIADLGQSLSNSSNAKIANIGDKLYSASGQNVINSLKSKGSDILNKGWNNAVSKAGNWLGNSSNQTLANLGSKISGLGSSAGSTSGALSSTSGLSATSTPAIENALSSALNTGLSTGANAAGESALTSAIASEAPTAAASLGSTLGTTGAAAGATGLGSTLAGAGLAAAGALSTAAPFIGAGLLAYNTLKSADDEKKAQAMQLSANAAQEGQNTALNNKQTAMRNLSGQNTSDNSLNGNNSTVNSILDRVYGQGSQINTAGNNLTNAITNEAPDAVNSSNNDIINSILGLSGILDGNSNPNLENIGASSNALQDYQNNLTNSLGQTGAGNIDLYNRPVVQNNDGTISTVRSMSFNDGKNEILIPTVADDGTILSDEEAIDNYYKTGKYLGKFDTAQEANAYAQQLHNEQDNYYNGTATGGAASVIGDYQNYLRNNGYGEDIVNGVSQGLNGGYKEIDDWIKQYNQGAGSNNPINIPQTEDETALAKEGKFNVPKENVQPQIEQQQEQLPQNISEEDVKKSILQKFASGLSDFTTGYQDNRLNSLKAQNLLPDSSKNKMQRLGEVLGTTARIAQSPLVQGAIAGGLTGALSKNALKGLATGYEFANNRAMNNLYADILKQRGIYANAGTFGNIDKDTASTLIDAQQKDKTNQIANDKVFSDMFYKDKNYNLDVDKYLLDVKKAKQAATDANRKYEFETAKFDRTKYDNDRDYQYKIDKLKQDAAFRNKQLEIVKEKIRTEKIKQTNKDNEDITKSDGYKKSLGDFYMIMTNPNSSDELKAKKRQEFMSVYGQDPVKAFSKIDDDTFKTWGDDNFDIKLKGGGNWLDNIWDFLFYKEDED